MAVVWWVRTSSYKIRRASGSGEEKIYKTGKKKEL
jgi:hypothetical protein